MTRSPLVATLTLLAAPALSLAATFAAMSQRLPASTDTIIAINVEKVLDSPYAKQQQWRDQMAENWAKRPAVIPPGVNKLLMGAEFVPSKAETNWEVTLLDMQKMPSMKDLAQAEGGSIDRVWNIDAVASPINAYFVPIEPTVLAVCTPGERSVISRWARQPVKEDTITSNYIKSALTKLDDDTGVMMALDLEGAYSLPKIRRYLANSEIEELKTVNLDAAAQQISSLKGLTMHIVVASEINGRVVITFDKDISTLSKVAQPLLIAVLKTSGMALPDLEKWKFTASGSELRGSGPLSDAAFKDLVGIVQSPIPAAVGAPAPGNATADPKAVLDPAAASQRYFKSVSQVLDNLSTGNSMGETATWCFQAAKRIDKFPIVNVDPALLEWGNMVSMKLKQLAGGGKVGQGSINARVSGVASQRVDTSYWDNDGYYHYQSYEDPETSRQRRQAAQEQKTQLQQQALQIFQEVNGTRQKMRQDMTAKYSVEF